MLSTKKGKWGNSLFKMEELVKGVSVRDGGTGAIVTTKQPW